MIKRILTPTQFDEVVQLQPAISLAIAFGQYVELPEPPSTYPCFVSVAGESVEIVSPERCYYAAVNDWRGWVQAYDITEALYHFEQAKPDTWKSDRPVDEDLEIAFMGLLPGAPGLVRRGDNELFWIRRDDASTLRPWGGRVFMRRHSQSQFIHVALTNNPAEALEAFQSERKIVLKHDSRSDRFRHVTSDQLWGPTLDVEPVPVWVVDGRLSLRKPPSRSQPVSKYTNPTGTNVQSGVLSTAFDDLAGLAGNVNYDVPNRKASLIFPDREIYALGRWPKDSQSHAANALTTLHAAWRSGMISIPANATAKLCVDGRHVDNVYVQAKDGELKIMAPPEVKLADVYTLSWKVKRLDGGSYATYETRTFNVKADNPAHALQLLSGSDSVVPFDELAVVQNATLTFSGGTSSVKVKNKRVYPAVTERASVANDAVTLLLEHAMRSEGNTRLHDLQGIVLSSGWNCDRINIWFCLSLLIEDPKAADQSSDQRNFVLQQLLARADASGFAETASRIKALLGISSNPVFGPVNYKTGADFT